jgi:hypothetical protein
MKKPSIGVTARDRIRIIGRCRISLAVATTGFSFANGSVLSIDDTADQKVTRHDRSGGLRFANPPYELIRFPLAMAGTN